MPCLCCLALIELSIRTRGEIYHGNISPGCTTARFRYRRRYYRRQLQDGPVKLTVRVVPLRGEDKGARLEFGGAEIK